MGGQRSLVMLGTRFGGIAAALGLAVGMLAGPIDSAAQGYPNPYQPNPDGTVIEGMDQPHWWLGLGATPASVKGDGSQYSVTPTDLASPDRNLALGFVLGYQPANSPYVWAAQGRVGQSLGDNLAAGSHSETYGLIDLQVGKDRHKWLFGHSFETKVISFGARLAGFTADTSAPGGDAISRDFFGIGPRVAVDAMVPLIGPQLGLAKHEQTAFFDFGLGLSYLLGWQSATSTGVTTFDRHGTAGVPTVDAYVGVSFYNARLRGKFSVGYRADMFFGAFDDGYTSASSGDRTSTGIYLGWVQQLR